MGLYYVEWKVKHLKETKRTKGNMLKEDAEFLVMLLERYVPTFEWAEVREEK